MSNTSNNFSTHEAEGLTEHKSTATSGVHVGHVTLDTLISGERQAKNVLATVEENATYSAARSTAAVSIGATGATGDRLKAVVVTVIPTTAALTIVDGAGTIVCSIPTTGVVIGDVIECNNAIAASGGFKITLHATGAGTVTALGTFT